MSRTYALSLIFAAVTLTSGLFYGQYRYLTDGVNETAAYAEEVHERVIAGQLEEIQEQTSVVFKLLNDETKERFRPIIGFAYHLEEKREAYLKLSKSINPNEEGAELLLNKLTLLHDTQLTWLEEEVTEFLLEHGEQIDLNKRDIMVKTNRLKTKLEEFRNTASNLQEVSMNSLLKRDLLTVDYLNAVKLVLFDVYILTGGITLNCFPPPDYHPVINNGFSDPQLGETITTTVSIGKLDYSHIPEDMFVLINGDTLHMNDFGMEPYSFKPNRRGKQVLRMELHVRNPLTGHTHLEGVNHYSFHVR